MVPQPFAARGDWSYPEFWAVTGGPRYPRYKTLTVLLKGVVPVGELDRGGGSIFVVWPNGTVRIV
jgi:hypothetical protein